MTNKELRDIAEKLSGLPSRKNKHGAGAFRWLADKLDVHPSTIARWRRGKDNTGPEIPEWATDKLNEMLEEHRRNERTVTIDKMLAQPDVGRTSF